METLEQAEPPRPASHYWAIFLAFALAATNLGLWLGGVTTPLRDPFGALALAICTTFLVVYFTIPRSRLAFYAGVVCLVLFPIRSVQGVLSFIPMQGDESGLHPKTIQTPFVVVNLIIMSLFLLLLWRFSSGAKSRAYFGLPPITKTPERELSLGE